MDKILNNLRKSILYLQKAMAEEGIYGNNNKHLLHALNIMSNVNDEDLNRLIINDKIQDMENNIDNTNDMENKKLDVGELYAYITKHMTAEEALMIMLKGKIVDYNVLRYSKDNEIHPLMLIVMAANEMGWNIALKNYDDDKDEDVEGIIVGTEEYVNSVLDMEDNWNISLKTYDDDTTYSSSCCGGNTCQGCSCDSDPNDIGDPNDTDAKTIDGNDLRMA
jgi:hypothetical protein